jgi:hypothetical protein
MVISFYQAIKTKLPLTLPDGKHLPGRLDLKTGTLIKKVNGSKHKMKVPPAWALDAVSLNSFGSRLKAINLLDQETGLNWATSIENFRAHAFDFNRGYGKQYALPLKYWAGTRTPVATGERLPISPGPSSPSSNQECQLSLTGV